MSNENTTSSAKIRMKKRVAFALQNHDINTIDDLCALRLSKLKDLRGIGVGAIKHLKELAEEHHWDCAWIEDEIEEHKDGCVDFPVPHSIRSYD
jgi:DNA-directed RNA polymerase alpha subunit